MIKDINKQGKKVLYEHAAPVVPILNLNGQSKEISSLTEQSTEKGLPQIIWPDMYLELIKDLIDTAENIADQCMGLASTQIWDKEDPCPSIFIMRWPHMDDKDPRHRGWEWQEFINPIIKTSGKTLKLTEGCLSYPLLYLKKKRPEKLSVKYQNADGDTIDAHFEGLAARVFHHEMDHMEGKTFLDGVSKIKLQSARQKQKILKRKVKQNGT